MLGGGRSWSCDFDPKRKIRIVHGCSYGCQRCQCTSLEPEVTPSAHVYFADIPLHTSLHPDSQPLSIPIAPVRTARPPSTAAFSEARVLSMRGQSTTLDWKVDDIMGPDVSMRETLLILAKMTSNAYVEPDTDWWYNLTDEWGIVRSHFVFSEWRICTLTRGPDVCSTLRSGGSRMTTVSDGFCLTLRAPCSDKSAERPSEGGFEGLCCRWAWRCRATPASLQGHALARPI